MMKLIFDCIKTPTYSLQHFPYPNQANVPNYFATEKNSLPRVWCRKEFSSYIAWLYIAIVIDC